MREKQIDRIRLSDETHFAVKQIATGIDEVALWRNMRSCRWA